MTTTNHNTVTRENPTAALWRIVVAEYESEKAAYARVCSDYEAACRRHEQARPKEPELLTVYKVTDTGLGRDRLIVVAGLAITLIDYTARTDLTADERAEITEKATRLADEFLAWSAELNEAWERFRPAEEAHDAAVSKLMKARDKLIATPAPDYEAMLFKLDSLVPEMVDALADDAERVTAIRDDARRLLGSK